MHIQITDNGRSNRMLYVNCAQKPHINYDSHTECYKLTMHRRHILIKIPTECCMLMVHGSHTLIKIAKLNAAC